MATARISRAERVLNGRAMTSVAARLGGARLRGVGRLHPLAAVAAERLELRLQLGHALGLAGHCRGAGGTGEGVPAVGRRGERGVVGGEGAVGTAELEQQVA